MVWPLLVFGALVSAPIAGTAIAKRRKAKAVANTPADGHPAGTALTVGLTNPGVPQPTGVLIALTPLQNLTQSLHDNAAKLMVRLATFGQIPGTPIDEVKQFQQAFNATNPVTLLLVDGLYSTKTQAAFQSAITPAIAPDAIDAVALVAKPADPAPEPNLDVAMDIGLAANGLLHLLNDVANKQGSFKEVTTFQTAWNAHHANQPVIVDGQYGANAQNALQSVLNWLGKGQQAPKNPYGSIDQPIPVFIP